MRSRKDAILEHQKCTEPVILTLCLGIKPPSAWINTTWACPRISPTESTSKITNPSTGSNSIYQRPLDEWLKLGVVRKTRSIYNSPILCVSKKQGQGLRIVQDFWQLNQHSHIDKNSMKEINQCIGDIGRANSSIFSTLDLTSGFWQMKLEEESQPLIAFTIPGRGQFHWITSPMGLLGCPASFQRLMEQVLWGIQNVLIYIDDVLIHTDTHECHLEVLEQVLMRLHQNHLKINLDKCLFGNQQVSYLRFTLTPLGIKPGKAKLKAIKSSEAPNDIKSIRSFVGLCNFFRNHIQNFAITSSPLFKLIYQDYWYLSGPLPRAAPEAFWMLQTQLGHEPTLAFPRAEREYLLITNTYQPTPTLPGGLCATLAQKKTNKDRLIPFHMRPGKSRRMKKITHPFYSRQPPLFGAYIILTNT